MEQISTDELRRMDTKEGLIIQGCGGDLQVWVKGINQILAEEGILQDSEFKNVQSFRVDGFTCLLFPFEGVKLDVGKLAMWRLRTYGQFHGTWLSDFVPNKLGGFLSEHPKPDCPLIGQDGNIFNLIGIASHTLQENRMEEQADEMQRRILSNECDSYSKALCIIGEYVNITSLEDPERSDLELS